MAFNRPTTFILGAGASCHYGYPTGLELVEAVKEKARKLYLHCQNAHDYELNCLAGKLELLHTKLIQTNPLVIDYFLEQNKSIQNIGKTLIAWVLLECENTPYNHSAHNQAELTKWHRFILSKLVSNIQSYESLENQNNVTFLTFNYDVSLETHLLNALQNTDIFQGSDIAKFIKSKTIHLYGSIRDDLEDKASQFPNSNEELQDGGFKHRYQKAFKASMGIRTIGGKEKDNDPIFLEAHAAIRSAATVYILGYGFDSTNNKRLKLDQLLKEDVHNKRVLFTNYGDANVINKRVSHIIWGSSDDKTNFIPPSPSTHGNFREPPYFEKSTRDVYGAFSKDFDIED